MQERPWSKPRPLALTLKDVLRNLGLGRGHRRPPAQRLDWLGAVGPDLAAETAIVAYRGGRVIVEVSTGVLKSELELFCQEELLSALRRRHPDQGISELVFRVKS